MLSLEQCRQILGPAGCQMTDAELENLRDQFYALADIAISAFLEQHGVFGKEDAKEGKSPKSGETQQKETRS